MLCIAIGPRRFLPAILVLWGGVAASFAAVRGRGAFLALRLLLGLSEAGVYPATMHVLSLWMPPSELGVAFTWVVTSTAVSGLLGAPLAAALLSLEGRAGLRGWQWLFLLESVPSFLLAAALPFLLPRSPLTARFLLPAERRWLWEHLHAGTAVHGSVELAAVEPGAEGGRSRGDGAPGEVAAEGAYHRISTGEQEQLLAPAEGVLAAEAGAAAAAEAGEAVEVTALLTPAAGAAEAAEAAADAAPGAALRSDDDGRMQVAAEQQQQQQDGLGGRVAASSLAGAAGGAGGASDAAADSSSGGGLSLPAVRSGLLDRRIWHLLLAMLLIEVSLSACIFWLPSLVKAALQVSLGLWRGWELGHADPSPCCGPPLAVVYPPTHTPLAVPAQASSFLPTRPACACLGRLQGELGADRDDGDSDDDDADDAMALLVRASLLSAVPYCAAAVVMVANARHSRAAGERRLHTALPLLAAAVGLALLPLAAEGGGPAAALVALTLAVSGIWATHGPFFSWPAAVFAADQQAGTVGFALVKTGGSVGSFAGPFLVGALADLMHGYTIPMLVLAGAAVAAAGVVYGGLRGEGGGELEGWMAGGRACVSLQLLGVQAVDAAGCHSNSWS